MNLLIPMTKDRFRLLQDIPNAFQDWDDGGKYIDLPAGSIISFDKIKVTKTTKPSQNIVVNVRVHFTDRRFTMKMYGGKAGYGRSFYVTYEGLAKLDLELAKDVP